MSDRSAIEEQIARFINAYNAGDLQGVMSCYSDDLVKTRNGAECENKRQVEARLAEVMRDFSGKLTVVNDEIIVSGALAFARGSLQLKLTPRPGGDSRTVSLRYLEIWQKVNGTWLVTRTMDNVR